MATFDHRVLLAWRLESGMRPEEVCYRTPVSFSYLRAIENGHKTSPSIELLERLAALYGGDVRELFTAPDPAGAR